MDQTADILTSLQRTHSHEPFFTGSQLENAIDTVLKRREKRHRDDTGNGSEAIGTALRTFREGMGISTIRMGRDIGRDPSLIQRIEKGQRGMSIETLARIMGSYKYRNANVAQLVIDILDAIYTAERS